LGITERPGCIIEPACQVCDLGGGERGVATSNCFID
jgi:hypothetical protein